MTHDPSRRTSLLWRGSWVLGLGSLLLAGCSAVLTALPPLPILSTARQDPSSSAWDDGHADYVGAIHIHTTYSHDAMGTFEDAVRMANAQRLDYLVITEHNNLKPLQEGKQGWHGATLVLIGTELSTSGGHYLAMNVTREIDRSGKTPQQIIDEVNAQGGFGFIAHPFFKKSRWRDYSVTGITGIEGYNTAHDTLDENKLRLALWTLTAPEEPFYFSILDRPYDPLATWDQLVARHGRMVGIGSTDAHEFHALGLRFAPYRIMFQLSRTHVLIPGALTPEAFYSALRAGHAYFSIELELEAKGFSFIAHDTKQVLGIMGDELPWQPGLHLAVSLPTVAHLTCFKDGQPIATITNQQWDVPVSEPGAYRIEASRHSKPWIFSNPIYVRPPVQAPDPNAQATHDPGLTTHD